MRHGEGQTVCRYEFSTARVSLPLPSRGHQEWPLLASTYVRIYLYAWTCAYFYTPNTTLTSKLVTNLEGITERGAHKIC